MPTPTEVQRRLEALRAYAILDTPPEAQFDDLARIASYICGTPIALISLLDAGRQWFKARVGLDATETPIEQAFCVHTIETPEVMVVQDARDDARFAQNPLVTGDPHIRFYAGAPLTSSEGVRFGTLCAIDRKPRDLSPEAATALKALASHVSTLIELRNLSRELHRALTEKHAAESEAQTLRGLLPICSYCRNVRDDDSYWQRIEQYLARRSGLTFTHSVCPDCYPRAAADLGVPVEVVEGCDKVAARGRALRPAGPR